MRIPATYYPRESPVHRVDARVKLLLLVAYTVCLFLAATWRAMAVLVLLLAIALYLSHLPAGALARTLIPLYVLMLFAVLFNAFTFNPEGATAYSLGASSAGVFSQAAPVAVGAGLWFLPAGLVRSLFYCVRVAAMVLASLLVAYSTPATQITSAFAWYMRPLRKLRVPVDDIAFTLTLALRFIPMAFEELQQLKVAQSARCANFDTGGVVQRFRAWGPVLVPWLVALYRRAERIATAMDVRAYGLSPADKRTTLNPLCMRKADWALLASCLAASVLPCLLLV